MDKNEKILRQTLITFLKGGNAYMPFSEAVENFPMNAINTIFPNSTYTPWHLLEHLRFTQHDIFDFIVNPAYKEPEWPKDYWPKKNTKATPKDWQKTIQDFFNDLKRLEDLVHYEKTDLYAKISWGTGQTILREILLVCDHSAYHTGEFSIMRQVMGTWPKKRST